MGPMRLTPAAFLLLACLSAFAAETRKNVLLLVSDDCRAGMGTYGGPGITPNIDALAREGRPRDLRLLHHEWFGDRRR